MNNLFSFDNLITDGAIWLALITINMTIIGLTSLVETKRVIGVDYGKFLIRKYSVGGCVRIYYLLVVFAIINVISLFSMFVQLDWFKLVNFAIFNNLGLYCKKQKNTQQDIEKLHNWLNAK